MRSEAPSWCSRLSRSAIAQTRRLPATRKPRDRQWYIWLTFWFSSVQKFAGGEPFMSARVPQISQGNVRSKAAPVWRHAVVAMQLRFLRTITPIEILVRPERRCALQLVFADVEFVRLEPGVVAQPAPGQWKQIGPHAEESAKTQHGVGNLARDLVDHQPFDVADHVAVRSPYRGALDAIARNQLMR